MISSAVLPVSAASIQKEKGKTRNIKNIVRIKNGVWENKLLSSSLPPSGSQICYFLDFLCKLAVIGVLKLICPPAPSYEHNGSFPFSLPLSS
jgi:hypothetical protein